MKKLYILSVQYYMQEIDDIDFFLFFVEDCDCGRVIGVITMARVFITRSQVV